MPRFSVIVPAHRVQAYLGPCLDSVLGQSFTDLEVVAVDDCSPDACGELLDEAAAADPRVTVVHLAKNAGLGGARNAGLRRATGDYVVFLDGDDTLTPGALRAVDDRLRATGDPDLLVYDYARAYWHGRTVRNVRAGLLAERPGPAVFRPDERPSLLMLLMVAWNKAYRRDFLQRHGFAFPPGYYEDTPWTTAVLLSAASVTTLDRVCVHYRQRRAGNILGTTSRRHFDLFDQYDRVFAFLDARPGLDHWRPLLHRRMTEHLMAVYTAPARLPAAARAEFFRRARAYIRRHRPAGATAGASPAGTRAAGGARGTGPGGGHGLPPRPPGARLRQLLVRAGTRRLLHLALRGNRARLRLGGTARAAYPPVRRAALRLHYAVQRCRPLDPRLAVFAAYWHGGYACGPAAIEAKVRELAPHIRTAWITTPAHAHTLPPGVRRLHPGSPAYWTALARARFLVNNVNFTAGYVKRPGQLHVQTHHGTPLKHMGLDLQAYPAAARGLDFGKLLEHVDRWDYSLSANRHSTLAWERAYPARWTTLEYGSPRNDVLLTATAADIARVRADLGVPAGTTTLLYAPTHRDYVRDRTPRLDLGHLARALGPEWTLLVRPHYFTVGADGGARAGTGRPAPAAAPDTAAVARPEEGGPPGGAERGTAHVRDVSRHPSVEELCLAADVLVTDYSSIMFDYLALDRPVVVHAEDWETYRATRGTYVDLLAHPPGPVTRTEEELTALLRGGGWRGARSDRLRAAFRARFPSYDDGRAAERVVRRVFLGEEVSLPAAARRTGPRAPARGADAAERGGPDAAERGGPEAAPREAAGRAAAPAPPEDGAPRTPA